MVSSTSPNCIMCLAQAKDSGTFKIARKTICYIVAYYCCVYTDKNTDTNLEIISLHNLVKCYRAAKVYSWPLQMTPCNTECRPSGTVSP